MKLFYAKRWVSKYLRYHPHDVNGSHTSSSLNRAIVRLSHKVYRGHGLKGHDVRQIVRRYLRSMAKSIRYNSLLTRLSKRTTRVVLNIATLGGLVWMGWYAKLLFGHSISDPLRGSLILIGAFVGWILFVKLLLKRYRRVFPSFKLTTFAMLCVLITFTFAGVQPLAGYKDGVFDKVTTYWDEQRVKTEEMLAQAEAEKIREAEELARIEAEKNAAEYARRMSEAVMMSELIGLSYDGAVLHNPSWEELKAFLLEDDTDKHPYVFPTYVCCDFALALQENAKQAGWRCAFVSMRTEGFVDEYNFGIPSNTGHACNAFETTDRGLIYIDCTGSVTGKGPRHHDCITQIEVGKKRTYEFIFPTKWIAGTSSSTVVSMSIRW